VSKVFGVSSLNMIGALLEKDMLSADEIAEMAKGKLKRKVNQLVKALNGNVTDHHRFLLKPLCTTILPEGVVKIELWLQSDTKY